MRNAAIGSVLVLALSFLVGCSSGDAPAADGGGGSDTKVDSPAVDSAGGGDSGSCLGPLTGASSFCQPTFADQVTGNPCDSDPPNTTRTCGSYKVWETMFIGSQACVYNAAGTVLVGARDCDSAFSELCPSGCFAYGIPESAYATCGADEPACPP